MTEPHRIVAIVPARDIDASEAFYRRLGFEAVSDYGDYRLLADGRGGHLHFNATPGWPPSAIPTEPWSGSAASSPRAGRRPRHPPRLLPARRCR